MRTASLDSPALAAIDRRTVARAARRVVHAVLDEVLTLVLLTGFAAVLFVEFH